MSLVSRIVILAVVGPPLVLGLAGGVSPASAPSGPWKRHTIDNTGRGADGVRLADINADGRLDITTAWEESGHIRVYLNPGHTRSKQAWPAVTVGQVRSPEDAVFFDVDGDGHLDIVSSCEGQERALFVHWSPAPAERLLDPAGWRTEALPAASGLMQWMFAMDLDVDGKNGPDLVAGGKNRNAQIGWFEAPPDRGRLAAWKWHTFQDAGWIMSLLARDMDGDGDQDLLVSDRRGPTSGVFWLENPGSTRARPSNPGVSGASWPRHAVGATNREVMFIDTGDLDGDGLVDVVSAVKPTLLVVHRRTGRGGLAWQQSEIPLPSAAGSAKAVRVADIDGDGRADLVFSCEDATGTKSGVMWLSRNPAGEWVARDISGPEGVKFDLIELLDLDGDGDLDVITCEETENLGVIWYENPMNRNHR